MAAQVRTFTWSGQDLASATNPENGTVTYAYDGAHRVTSRTDAKGQQTQYTYDSYGRVTEVRHYPTGWSNDDANQRWDYYYDSNPFDGGGYSTYTWGRLAAVQFGSVTGYPTQYIYSYNVAGRVSSPSGFRTGRTGWSRPRRCWPSRRAPDGSASRIEERVRVLRARASVVKIPRRPVHTRSQQLSR